MIQQEEQKLILVTGVEPGGTNEYWKVNNIYDLAGNVYEWTQEKYSTGSHRTVRGGEYDFNGNKSPAANRYADDESTTGFYLKDERIQSSPLCVVLYSGSIVMQRRTMFA